MPRPPTSLPWVRAALLAVAFGTHGAAQDELPTLDGYRGIWYQIPMKGAGQPAKYSGGCATYPQQHIPIAVHAPAVRRTYFCYGGVAEDGGRNLLHMISYYDHATRTVPRPRVLLDKRTGDAHDNPSLAIDEGGHVWVFANAHGHARPAFIRRSVRPHDISAFEAVDTPFTGQKEENFSYAQPWVVPGRGFLMLHTHYQSGDHRLFTMASPDGRAWSGRRQLVDLGEGSYQISWQAGGVVGTAFDQHPGGLDRRTDVHYLQSADGGTTWTTAGGQVLAPPVRAAAGPSLVHDYQAEGLLVYLKDLQFDRAGRPVIMYLTSGGHAPGRSAGIRQWWVAAWQGTNWRITPVTTSDHNYDHGSLYLEDDARWQVIAPTDPGPQPGATGGEVVQWVSADRGATWTRGRTLTAGSRFNHTYVRHPHLAHDDLHALWCDGDPGTPSPSRLYATDRAGSGVWRFPGRMAGAEAPLERLPDPGP